MKMSVGKTILLVTATLLSLTAQSAERMTIGRFNSRAIFSKSNSTQCPAPLVIMVPGSGANGPEEMIPASLSGDSNDQSIFAAFTESLSKSNVGTLALGKPGIEFFSSWNKDQFFYNKNLYVNLGWQDLIDNLSDAVNFAKSLPCVDQNKIYVLGHSEGTNVAADYAKKSPRTIHGIILVGLAGENLGTTVDWQIFRRPIDSFIEPDIDTNHDGFVSKEEASLFPKEFSWDFKPDQDKVSFSEIEQFLRSTKELQDQYQKLATSKIWNGVFNRAPLYQEIAALPIDVYAFTGSLDVQTRPEEALRLKEACYEARKANCEVQIVNGLGHGMSRPAGPRAQKLLDATLGPVDNSFNDLLQSLGLKL